LRSTPAKLIILINL